jgi:tRNA dimethylallyltransferase
MYDIVTITGPTASGKTGLAVALAAALDGEIISADSRQVYRGMDIGTGKDLTDYVVAGRHIPYHLIDICRAGEKYNLFRYQRDFHKAFADIKSRGKTPVLCGGTGLYIAAVLRGYRLSGVEVEQSPPPLSSLIVAIRIDRDARREKITRRLKSRLDEGMLEEIKKLLAAGVPADDLIYYGLEYRYLTLHVLGKLSYAEMFRQLEIAIHRFAKRQMTWFRGMERRGFVIHWLDEAIPTGGKVAAIRDFLK